MRYGIVSDIHSNLSALETALDRLRDVDKLICPGDVVGYGPDPNECCSTLRTLECVKVIGNHDAVVCGVSSLSWFNPDARKAALWNRETLTDDHVRWLQAFPSTYATEDYILTHGSLFEPARFPYIHTPNDARQCFDKMGEIDLCFIGHTHVSEVYVQKIGEGGIDRLSFVSGGKLDFKPGFRYIVNVGSIGQPRDGNPMAACGIYDSEAHSVEIMRLAYDVESVQNRMRDAGLPQRLIERLNHGE